MVAWRRGLSRVSEVPGTRCTTCHWQTEMFEFTLASERGMSMSKMSLPVPSGQHVPFKQTLIPAQLLPIVLAQRCKQQWHPKTWRWMMSKKLCVRGVCLTVNKQSDGKGKEHEPSAKMFLILKHSKSPACLLLWELN